MPHLPQRVDFFGYRAQRPTLHQTLKRLLLTNRAHAAGNTLAAGFMAKEGGDAEKDPRKVDGVVKQHDDAGAKCGANRARDAQRHA